MKSAQERFQELQKKSNSIIQGAIQINTKIEAAQNAYQKTAQQSQEKFQTSNVNELKEKLASWTEENNAQVDKLEQRVNSVEKEVEDKNTLIRQIQQSAT